MKQLSFPFLHVGARYYDPSTGRFLQRDTVGILGGRNVYAYVRNLPTRLVDPLGVRPHDGLTYEIIFHNRPPKLGPKPKPPKRPKPPETPQQELRRIKKRLAITAAAYGVAAACTFWAPPVSAAFGAGAAVAGGAAGLLD